MTMTWDMPWKEAFLILVISFSWMRSSCRLFGMLAGISFSKFFDRYRRCSLVRGLKALGWMIVSLLFTRIRACKREYKGNNMIFLTVKCFYCCLVSITVLKLIKNAWNDEFKALTATFQSRKYSSSVSHPDHCLIFIYMEFEHLFETLHLGGF